MGSRRDEFVADTAELFADLRGSWMGSLLVTAFFLPVVAVVARGLATVGLLTPGLTGPIVAAAILTAVCLIQLGSLIAGVVRSAPGRSVSGLLSLGLYVETFAVVTACVWRAAGHPVSPWGGLWRAESFYLWQLLHAIPLLDITGTIGWRQPAYAATHVPAGLVLAFQLVIIPQLLRAAVGGYQFAISLATTRHARSPAASGRSRWWAPRLAGGVIAALAVTVAGVTWIAVQVLDRGSWFFRWWVGTALPALHAAGPPAERWVTVAPAIVLLLATVYPLGTVVFTAVGLSGLVLPNARSWWTTVMVLVAAAAEIYGIMLWDSGLLLTLSRLGLGVQLPGTAATPGLLETLNWHVLHTLPGPDVGGVLHWRAPYAVAGGFAGWVLLSLKTFVVAAIAFLALPIVRIVVVRTRYGPVVDVWGAALAAATRAAGEPDPEDFLADEDWGSYRHRRERLDHAARQLRSTPRFAALAPALDALLDTVPGGGPPLSPEDAAIMDRFPENRRSLADEERGAMVAALLAFRAAVFDALPGASAVVADKPAWLSSPTVP